MEEETVDLRAPAVEGKDLMIVGDPYFNPENVCIVTERRAASAGQRLWQWQPTV
jgi:hypothetical protein